MPFPSQQCILIQNRGRWNHSCSFGEESQAQELATIQNRFTEAAQDVAHGLLQKIQGRTLAFFGDSITHQHWSETTCAFMGISPRYTMESVDQTGVSGAGICVRFPEFDAQSCYIRYDKEMVDPVIEKAFKLVNLTSHDLAVINIGIHHSPKQAGVATSKMVAELSKVVDKPLVLWRETAPQHFTASGIYSNSSGPHKTKNGCADDLPNEANQYNQKQNPIVSAAGIPIIEIWGFMKSLGRFHIGSDFQPYGAQPDCSHWCQGGLMHMKWNTEMLRVIRQQTLGPGISVVPSFGKRFGDLESNAFTCDSMTWEFCNSIVFPWMSDQECIAKLKGLGGTIPGITILHQCYRAGARMPGTGYGEELSFTPSD